MKNQNIKIENLKNYKTVKVPSVYKIETDTFYKWLKKGIYLVSQD